MSALILSTAAISAALRGLGSDQTLVLVNECTGWTEVGSLFLKADRRKGGAGRLLSQSRYMLIGAQPELFDDNVLAELRGVFTPDGACPFWDHVAHKFFPMEFDEADRMTRYGWICFAATTAVHILGVIALVVAIALSEA